MAVLPTPGSPISTGLFLVLRERIWIVRRISSSRPMTGSSLPLRACVDEVAAILLERLVGCLGCRAGHALAAAHLRQRLEEAARASRRARPAAARRGVRAPDASRARTTCSTETYSSLRRRISASASSSTCASARDMRTSLPAPDPLTRGRRGQVALEICLQGSRRDPCALQKPRDKTVGLCQECQQDVLDVDLRVAIAERPGLRIVQGLLCLLGQQIRIHAITSGGWEARSGSAAPRVRRCVRAARWRARLRRS